MQRPVGACAARYESARIVIRGAASASKFGDQGSQRGQEADDDLKSPTHRTRLRCVAPERLRSAPREGDDFRTRLGRAVAQADNAASAQHQLFALEHNLGIALERDVGAVGALICEKKLAPTMLDPSGHARS